MVMHRDDDRGEVIDYTGSPAQSMDEKVHDEESGEYVAAWALRYPTKYRLLMDLRGLPDVTGDLDIRQFNEHLIRVADYCHGKYKGIFKMYYEDLMADWTDFERFGFRGRTSFDIFQEVCRYWTTRANREAEEFDARMAEINAVST